MLTAKPLVPQSIGESDSDQHISTTPMNTGFTANVEVSIASYVDQVPLRSLAAQWIYPYVV